MLMNKFRAVTVSGTKSLTFRHQAAETLGASAFLLKSQLSLLTDKCVQGEKFHSVPLDGSPHPGQG